MTPQSEWDRCKPWLQAALDKTGFYDMAYLERGLADGSLVFWPGKSAAAVTEFIEYPLCKVLNVFVGGGESNASLQEFLVTFEPELSAFAKANGCQKIIGFGRPGWEKVLPDYRKLWTVLAKEIA